MNEEKAAEENVIDLGEIVLLLWKRKYLISLITLLAAIYSVVSALNMPDVYRASAKLAPLSEGAGSGVALASQLGSLAGFAGFGGLAQSTVTKETIALETLSSFDFFKKYMYEDVVVDLMSFKSWDKTRQQIVVDEEIYDTKSKQWKGIAEVDLGREIVAYAKVV